MEEGLDATRGMLRRDVGAVRMSCLVKKDTDYGGLLRTEQNGIDGLACLVV